MKVEELLKETLQNMRKEDKTMLSERLTNLLKKHFELRMQHKAGQLNNVSQLRKIKKIIAKVKTIIREKE